MDRDRNKDRDKYRGVERFKFTAETYIETETKPVAHIPGLALPRGVSVTATTACALRGAAPPSAASTTSSVTPLGRGAPDARTAPVVPLMLWAGEQFR